MRIKNLGPIKSGEIKFNDLIVIWGYNNSGKTMLTYLLYAIREEFDRFSFDFSELESERAYYKLVNAGKKIVISEEQLKELYRQFQIYFTNNAILILSEYFSVDREYFDGFSIEFDDDEIYNSYRFQKIKSRGRHRQRINGRFILNIFSFEVIKDGFEFGLHAYDKDSILWEENIDDKNEETREIKLNFSSDSFNSYISGFIRFMCGISRNIYFPAERIGINQFRRELKTIRAISDDNFEFGESRNRIRTYPLPIQNYINLLFRISLQDNNQKYTNKLIDLIEGEFFYDEGIDEFSYISKRNDSTVPFNMLSSSLKSLLGISEYLNRTTNLRGSQLIVDEPEMNLHPIKQIEVLELFRDFVEKENARVVLSTHSSYITRKLINILLSNSLSNESNIIKPDRVNIYEVREGSINKIDLIENHDFIRNFDEITEELDVEYFSLIRNMEE